jgi:hypothetical protein
LPPRIVVRDLRVYIARSCASRKLASSRSSAGQSLLVVHA